MYDSKTNRPVVHKKQIMDFREKNDVSRFLGLIQLENYDQFWQDFFDKSE